MNETINAIMSRRSTRGFKTEQLKKDEINTIIDCGLNAPSAMNAQNWHFTVIQNKDLIDWMNMQIKEVLPAPARERMMARYNGSDDFSLFYNAPTVVIVSGLVDDKYSSMNCSFASENMCLAAESLNIGSCIIGLAALLFNTPKADEYIKELGIPNGYKPLYAVSFGYKDIDMTRPERVNGKVNFIV